jgi:SAM-dependent methyltransferase
MARWRGLLGRWLGRERPPEAFAAGWGTTPPLVAGHELGQWIHGARDGLSEVQILIGTLGRVSSCRLELAVRADPTDEAPIRVVHLPAAHVADNAYQPFAFPAIPDSAGRRYYLSLRSPDAVPGNAVVIASRPAWDPALASVVGGQAQPSAWRYLCRYGDGPPEEAADFAVLAGQFLRFAIERCRLRPASRVLDVGCRRGSWAVPLTGYLREGGSYDGFDIVADDIEWCRRSIGARHPHFRFALADIHNAAYNPGGVIMAAEFEFPYPAASFDFVFLISVFTHMLPGDVAHYLDEIARVLAPGGACLVTAFVLDAEARRAIELARSDVAFPDDHGVWRAADAATPEAAVAYDEGFLLDLYRRAGLAVEPPIHYGSWAGRSGALAYQDVIVASRRSAR